MTHDELRELERTRRRALWELANLTPGDPKVSDHLAILDGLDDQERNSMPPIGKQLEPCPIDGQMMTPFGRPLDGPIWPVVLLLYTKLYRLSLSVTFLSRFTGLASTIRPLQR